MERDLDGPADTAMMNIVHDALRRDLRRAKLALAAEPPADRTRPLADHITWMMRFLDAHHRGEDAGLYPAVRTANPAAAALLDAMDADHHAIHPAMQAADALAQQWAGSGSDKDRAALLAALDDLEQTLLPHLDREEADAMPLVSATLTHRQWSEWDQRYNVAPKSLPLLARLVVLYVFGPRYRRHATARWGNP